MRWADLAKGGLQGVPDRLGAPVTDLPSESPESPTVS